MTDKRIVRWWRHLIYVGSGVPNYVWYQIIQKYATCFGKATA
jgi:hypothetical protein